MGIRAAVRPGFGIRYAVRGELEGMPECPDGIWTGQPPGERDSANGVCDFQAHGSVGGVGNVAADDAETYALVIVIIIPVKFRIEIVSIIPGIDWIS